MTATLASKAKTIARRIYANDYAGALEAIERASAEDLQEKFSMNLMPHDDVARPQNLLSSCALVSIRNGDAPSSSFADRLFKKASPDLSAVVRALVEKAPALARDVDGFDHSFREGLLRSGGIETIKILEQAGAFETAALSSQCDARLSSHRARSASAEKQAVGRA